MIYDVTHVTAYKYDSMVARARCALRLLPIDGLGQRVQATTLDIDPAPTSLTESICFFGNRVQLATIDRPHRALKVTARSRVVIDRPQQPTSGATLEEVREQAAEAHSLEAVSPVHFLFPSRLAPAYEPATDYARQSFTPGRDIFQAARELTKRIRADFRYDPKATRVSTPLSEAFGLKAGVCQDFAHVMISGLRGLGLPASYVSGYIRTFPPAGKPRLQGADASHAWVGLWCGTQAGWLGFDPTNGIDVGNDHIVVANGRDYSDISPVSGVIVGSGEQSVDVSVDVLPVG